MAKDSKSKKDVTVRREDATPKISFKTHGDHKEIVFEGDIFADGDDLRRYHEFQDHFDGDMFGERLKIARLAQGLSQTVLAKQFEPELSQSAIVEWEKNRSQPKKERMADLAGFLQAPEVWLMLGKLSHQSARLHLQYEAAQEAISETATTSMMLEVPYEVEPDEISEKEVDTYFARAQFQLIEIFKFWKKDTESEPFKKKITTLESVQHEMLEALQELEAENVDLKRTVEVTKKDRDNAEQRTKKVVEQSSRSDLPFYWGKLWDKDFIIYNNVAKQLPLPLGLAEDPEAYVLYVYGFNAAPRFDQGEQIAVSPSSPPRYGDDVVVRMKRDDPNPLPGDAVRGCIRKLVYQDATNIVVRRYTDTAEDESIAADEVESVHKILSLDEICGW